ncbi:MAG: NADH-quinone oxidoreductase subunit D [Candidatus Azobacteroides pseudotrichonymphae]|jgi:NADH-quinone oxidoreductase subunit C/D|nr:NADH-quinone oxidoreductase subunit D [Bacteroidales bacterium OttesenSCG-928-I14]GMO32024.1 MAG: NADH-quinone oxidoreductase subunit D [Candidatus Azobacteroides pseudotrichonymphae]
MKIIDELLLQLSFVTMEVVGKAYIVSIPKEKLRHVAVLLRNNSRLSFNFLIDIVGIDYIDSLAVIYYLSSTQFPTYIIVLKTYTNDREDPQIDSVCDLWQSAGLYEREVHDFFGIRFIKNMDMRRLFLRQDWKGYPLRKDYNADMEINPMPLLNEDLIVMEKMDGGSSVFEKDDYVVNFGPQHPSTHGVLHLRVALDGEIIKKVDPNFGYIHRGIEKMCETYTYSQILHLTERLDYLSGTINRHGMCLAIEKGLELEIPRRAHYIRTIIDELTRIASHLLGWGCMAMDMGSITAFVYGMRDREKIMDIFEETCGGRLMANYSVIGGVMNDIHPNFQRKVKEFILYMRKRLKEHHLLFTDNPIARGRMEGVGFLSKEQAISLGATGPTGRASGWSNDIRKIEPYAAYKYVEFNEILRTDGLTFDRYIIRLDEIEESLKIIEQLIDNIPGGAFSTKIKAMIRLPEGEFYQRVESARGEFDVFIYSKGDKYPYRVKFRSPCMTLVNTLGVIAIGVKIADLVMLGGSLDYVVPCIDR